MAKGRPPKIAGEHQRVLVEIVQASRTATLEEIRSALERRAGIRAHAQTIQKSLREAGIERSLDGSAVRVQVAAERPARYGYTEAHRRQEPEQTYPGCLTDAEWALVEDLFDNEGGRGTPPQYPPALVGRCLLLRGADRLFLAHAAEGVSALAERVPDISALERAGEIRADARSPARAVAGTGGPGWGADGSGPGCAVDPQFSARGRYRV